MSKKNIKSLSLEQLEALALSLGEPRFRGRQLFQWLYAKGATSFEAMSNLPTAFRSALDTHFDLQTLKCIQMQTSVIDGTVKSLYQLHSGKAIETVLIPGFDEDGDASRLTVCVSSQVGCAMGCTFCATGQMGFMQNLHAGEIYDQVWQMNQLANEQYGRKITNVVFMGMGEPLQNYEQVLQAIGLLTSPEGLGLASRRITLSTVGLAGRIMRLADDDVKVNLAISLHAPTPEKRSEIMPVNRSLKTDLKALKEAVQYFYQRTKNQITYEYCIFDHFNDHEEDAKALAKIVRWAPSKVNLIMFNPVKGVAFEASREQRLNAFIRVLVANKVTVTVRRSRGQDIEAACGQLAINVGEIEKTAAQ
ncbi:MAG: 23S rRNA (adenine(2503)-C(2))-methyltransferase RlmN [Bacteroidetes Order II. Incertae sedis bacterium]|nr:23S rRNA (adenine(2503)-C(2))-methyltransferase RlmN [Bacteroidetes Order II. bacterium]